MGDGDTIIRVARAASVMLAGFGAPEPRRAHCGDCRGKGFALSRGPRAARKCQRCRGQGFTCVGSTKR